MAHILLSGLHMLFILYPLQGELGDKVGRFFVVYITVGVSVWVCYGDSSGWPVVIEDTILSVGLS